MHELRRSSIENVVDNATLEQAQYIVKALEKRFGQRLYLENSRTRYLRDIRKVGECQITTTTSTGIPTAWSNYIIEGSVDKTSVEHLLAEEKWDKAVLVNFFKTLDTRLSLAGITNTTKTKFSSKNYTVKGLTIGASDAVIGLSTNIDGKEYMEYIKIKIKPQKFGYGY